MKSSTGLKKKTHNILSFINDLEKVKRLVRHCWYTNGRRESVGEHTWRTAMMAMVLTPELKEKTDLGHVLAMILIHDIPEAHAGDHPAWKKKKLDKYEREKLSLEETTKTLPDETRKYILSLWQEFEDCKTPEAKLANACDKMEAIISHNQADIKTWKKSEKEFTLWYGDEYCQYEPILKELKDILRDITAEKIK